VALRRLLQRGAQLARTAHRRSAPRKISQRYQRLLADGHVRPLDRRQLDEIDDYARDVLGDLVMAGELQVLTALAGEFRPGWITDKFFGTRVLPRISTDVARAIGPVRTLLSTLVGTDRVPEIGRRIGGLWFDMDGGPTTRTAVAESASEHGSRVVVKTDGSMQSNGVSVLTIDELRAVEPSPGSDLVVQHLIRPHPTLGSLSPGSTPPVRILTIMQSGQATLGASHIRFGLGDAPVAGGPGTIRVPVSHTGITGPTGADGFLRLHRTHPTTGHELGGIHIPSFADAVADCLARHRRLPQAGALGWDIAIDETGEPHIMEINTLHPGMFFHEVIAGPSFVRYGWERFASGRST